jgi:type II secretory pathway pseudopilin PulG
MKLKSGGYTILEVMLFLAITAGMFGMAMRSFSGRQQTVQFSQAVNDLTQIFSSTSNDVRNGFSGEAKIECTNTTIKFQTGALTGQNAGCMYLGKILVISPDSSGSSQYKLHIFTVIAPSETSLNLTETSSPLDLGSIGARVVHADTAASRFGVESGVSLTNSRDLPWGVKLDTSLSATDNTFAVAYLNGLTEYNYRTLQINLHPDELRSAVKSGEPGLNLIATRLEEALAKVNAVPAVPGIEVDKTSSICLVDSNTSSSPRKAKLIIGASGDSLSVEPKFDEDCS